MADGVTIRITGPDLGVKVSQLNAEIQAQIEEELDRVADQTQSDAKDNCPVATGALQDDIKVYAEPFKRTVGNMDIPYAIYVHNGTWKMKARPYLFNAAEMNKQSFIDHMQDIKLSI